jgi:hypothetical protein
MPMILRGLCLAALLAAVPAAAADKIACPAEIKAATPQLATPVEGWTARADIVPTQLSGVAFYEGAPKDGGSLTPDDEKHAKSKITSTWRLGAMGSGPYWLGCRYANTALTLERQLPSGVKECTVSYDASTTVDGLPAIQEIACK